MRSMLRWLTMVLLGSLTLIGVVLGFATGQWVIGSAVAVVGLCFLPVAAMPQSSAKEQRTDDTAKDTDSLVEAAAPPRKSPGGDNAQSMIDSMLVQGRYALLLRPQILGNLSEAQARRAAMALDESMALVPEGDVLLTAWPGPAARDDEDPPSESVVRVDALYLDRYAVTNAQYHAFVAAGGYEQMTLWDAEILPGLLDFVDQTGQPGPRYWRNGTFPRGMDDHPVVGVSWYEAAAYARWSGKRLPSNAEWTKAAAWPVVTDGNKPVQRKFPWGDTMDRSRANLWGSGPQGTASVHEFADGVSVGGVYGLIGNVWEWTLDTFGGEPRGRLDTAGPMKGIRGGAFDTYFDIQANCHYHSADSPLARQHNIGFRCAVPLGDLAVNSNIDE